jgi:hypothetical protein
MLASVLAFLLVFGGSWTPHSPVQFGISVAWANQGKVEVCHFPPGNPDNLHSITINEKALSAHLAHGDLPGTCNAP